MTATETPKRGRPPKGGDTATTRAIRMTDSDWEALKRIGLDRMRELVRKDDAKRARARSGQSVATDSGPVGESARQRTPDL